MSIPRYQVVAYNTAKASENKIHDDATARRFGFKGGFVGGVSVYAYMSHQPVHLWGRTWLERGTGAARFAKPVYEGDVTEIAAVQSAEGLSLEVHSMDVLCATGQAALPTDLSAPPALDEFKSVPPRSDRLPANQATLPVGDWLGMTPLTVTEAFHVQELQDIRETETLYRSEGIVHTGTILRCCNWALTHNVVLPAWIHMGSTVRNLGLAHVGDTLNVRARITKNYEHKGHKWVELDAMVVANETTPIIRATHIAIYHPRQLAEAA